MKPPAFDIGYGVYRSFYFTEYVPPPPVKKSQTSKDPNEIDNEEPSNYYYFIITCDDIVLQRNRGVIFDLLSITVKAYLFIRHWMHHP